MTTELHLRAWVRERKVVCQQLEDLLTEARTPKQLIRHNAPGARGVRLSVFDLSLTKIEDMLEEMQQERAGLLAQLQTIEAEIQAVLAAMNWSPYQYEQFLKRV